MASITKSYEPQDVEKKWYAAWLEAGCFAGQTNPAKAPYTIMIPPPNVTGVLTMGHVLNNTLQDILVRRARLEGREALWLPGTDHAGIATQTVVERELRKEKKTRHHLGREKFLEKVWSWREEKGGIILKQLQALGASADWSRTQFTMDPAYSQAVLKVFVDLYGKGQIYRGKRMVNWCPTSLTALSDEEVIMKPTKGFLYQVRYELVEQPGKFIEVKTTRPETIPGDVAIAVHPDDPRYTALIGQKVWRPLNRAQIPIIADAAVDKEFGSGALKITPAHDKVDFEVYNRQINRQLMVLRQDLDAHRLNTDRSSWLTGFPEVIDAAGKMSEQAGSDLVGLDRFEARKKAAELLKGSGALVKEEPYENNVGYSERADVPIEPRLTWQWWLKYPRVEEAKSAVRDGHIKFYPERWSKVYLHWLENIQDWCISRQLWWGHRIPVWKAVAQFGAPEWSDSSPDSPERWTLWKNGILARVGNRGVIRAIDVSAGGMISDIWTHTPHWNPYEVFIATTDPVLQRELEADGFVQDSDVLDTWASSWLWPFATLGWPDKAAMDKAGFDYFYPTTTLVTGPDIIFFWVARMIMAGLEFVRPGESLERRIPFKNVYFTGIIRDQQGRKMSKSLGNSPDPLDLIAKYGADGLRFGIVSIAPQGQDIRFQEDRIEGGKNFCNKLWNACRFRQMNGDMADNSSLGAILARVEPPKFDGDDHAILDRLLATTREVDRCFTEFEFSAAVQAIYGFFWNDFCDWYVEVSKSKLLDPATKANCLAIQDLVLRQTLLLLHPFTPFITEELWQLLGYAGEGTFLMRDIRLENSSQLAGFGLKLDPAAAAQVAQLKAVLSQVRAFKAEQGEAASKVSEFVVEANDAHWAVLEANLTKLKRMMGAGSIVRGAMSPNAPAIVTAFGSWNLIKQLKGDPAAEKVRLAKELEALAKHIAGTETRLANKAFTDKAPAAVLDGARKQLADQQAKQAELSRLLAALG